MADRLTLDGDDLSFDELVVTDCDLHIERNHDGAIYISVVPHHGVGRFLLDVEASKKNRLWVGVTERPSEWSGEYVG